MSGPDHQESVLCPCRMLSSRKSLRFIPDRRESLYQELCDLLNDIHRPSEFKYVLLLQTDKNPHGATIKGVIDDISISIKMISLQQDEDPIPAAAPIEIEASPSIFRKLMVFYDNIMDGDFLQLSINDAHIPDDEDPAQYHQQIIPMLTIKTSYSCQLQLEKSGHPTEIYDVPRFVCPQFPVFIPPSCRMVYNYQGKTIFFFSYEPMSHLKKMIIETFGKDHISNDWPILFAARTRPVIPQRTNIIS